METLGQIQDRTARIEALRSIAKAVQGIENSLEALAKNLVTQGEETNATLQRIARAVENMGTL